MQIDYKYKEYINKFDKEIGLNDIQKLINDEIDNEFNSSLFIALKNYAIYNFEETGYDEYDFNNNIKNDIESIQKLII